MSECQQLPPFKACGLVGSCEGNETQHFCECAPGWDINGEMSLYFLTKEELNEGTGICNFNQNILLVLYTLVLISGLGALGLQIYVIRTRAQLRRLTPLLIGLSLQSVLAMYRLSRFEDALNGKDVFFSFLVSNAAFFNWFAANVFINKYFCCIATKAKFELEGSVEQFRKHQRINSIALIFELILYQICWTTILISDQQTTGRIMMKVKFGLLAIRALYFAWTIHLLFDNFIRGIKTFLNLTESRNNLVTSISSQQAKRETYIRKTLLPHTIRVKNQIILVTSAFSLFLLICALWDYALLFYGYFFPLNFISWSILNIAVLQFGLKTKSKKKQTKVTTSTANLAFKG